jgi:uncharacterized protein (TIGR02996 family)
MSLQSAFLADIAANVEDDAPRLVYADWLTDNGDPNRAAFIRAQCRLAKMGPCGLERFALEAEAEDLLARNEAKWRQGLPKTGAQIEFTRGFPHRFACTVATFLEHGEELLAAAPTLRDYFAQKPGRGWDELMRSPLLGRLSALDTGEKRLGVRRALDLAVSPHATGLRSLSLSQAGMTARGLDALLASPHLRGLRRLVLRGNELGNEGISKTVSADLPSLVALDIGENGLGPGGATALARSPLPPRLEELVIRERRGGDDLARALFSAEWPALRKLSLCLNQMSGAGAAALAANPSLVNLRELDLTLDYRQPLAPLFKAPHLARLERLGLNVSVRASAMESLAHSPMLANLRSLVAKDAGVAAVLASPASAGLVELSVDASDKNLAAVARAFVSAGHLTNLRKLAIGSSIFGDLSWLPVLLGAAHLAGVAHLDLSSNLLDAASLQALLDCPNLGGVRRLRLSFATLQRNAGLRQPLKDRFGPALRSG